MSACGVRGSVHGPWSFVAMVAQVVEAGAYGQLASLRQLGKE